MQPIDLTLLSETGIITKQLKNATPLNGCIRKYRLQLPEFEKGVINEANISGWVSGYLTRPTTFTSLERFEKQIENTIQDKRFEHAFNCGYYLLLKLKNGEYLSILPLVSKNVMSYVSLNGGQSSVKLCTFGTDSFTGEAPLFAYSYAKDPYTATQKCWEQAINSKFCKDNIQWRSKKEYPELYNYLGWCTWESFGGDITEENVSQSIKEIKENPVPVRWVIIDDGYLDVEVPKNGWKNQLLSFGVNNKFPNGWRPITALKNENTVKWMGIWRNMSGGMGGVSRNHTMANLKEHLMPWTAYRLERPGGNVEIETNMIIRPDYKSSEAFYNEMIRNSINGGFDFVKVDFQTYNFWMNYGSKNGVNAAHQNNKALETVCYENNVALLNCISQSNVNVFNTKYSVISRASVDVKLDNDNMFRTVQSFTNNMWWGDILVADLDMYHTSNQKTAQYLTIARAVSGGPIYISDRPIHFNKKLIDPLIFKDGKIIRTLAPAVPLADNLFTNYKTSCYRVIAPTRHKSCAIAAFNFTSKESIEGTISKKDYQFAAAKEQPYEGLWQLPHEGLVVYDWEARRGVRLNDSYKFLVNNMKGRIFNLSPIENGWAVIGLMNKYVGGCTYTIKENTKNYLKIILDESGPLIVYHNSKTPSTKFGEVTSLGNGFFKVDLKEGDKNLNLQLQLN
ncbi:hypothetical protein KFZ70_12525 [Tamlana fucoidanivorans]|nr:Sip1-related alpha-galactosidase [Tamlana fucoidanivorans]